MNFEAFIGGSNVSQSSIADVEDTVNLYFEPSQSPGASTKGALYPTPGAVEIGDLNVDPTRGSLGAGRAHEFYASREFAVIGRFFVEIFFDGTMTNIGTVTLDDKPATISYNGEGGHQLFITSGNNGYIFDLNTAAFTQISALDGIATMGSYSDGFFLLLDAGTSTFFISDLLDGLVWDPTQFTQRSAASDPWISLKVCGKYIYLLGTQTSEPWYNAGLFPFPFAPYASTVIQYGTIAAFSPEVLGTSLLFLSQSINGNGTVIKLQGSSPEVVSTFAVHCAMDGYVTLSDAIGDSYEDLGHIFYILTFPSANATWAWDQTTEGWAKRSTWNSPTNEEWAWRMLFHAFAFGQHRMLDTGSSKVFNMASNFGSDVDGLPIRRRRRAPSLVRENKVNFFARFELYMETGLGLVSGQGSDPQVMMRFSNNAKEWSNQSMRGAGKMGQYGTRVYWNRLGCGRQRVWEITMSDPIPWRILGCFLELHKSTE